MYHSDMLAGTNCLPEPLTENEKKETLQMLALKESELEARETLVKRNLRLVYHMSKKYQGTAVPMEDLFSIGCIGLIKAANTFDIHKNTKFATYAARCIENEILMYLRNNKKHSSIISLEEILSEDSDGNTFLVKDIVSDTKTQAAFDRLENESFASYVLTLGLNYMKYTEIIVILYRINNMNQREIAKRLDYSQSYISRLLGKAYHHLTKLMENSIPLKTENKIIFSVLEEGFFSVKFLKTGAFADIDKKWDDFSADYPLGLSIIRKNSDFLEICADDGIFVLLADFILYLYA